MTDTPPKPAEPTGLDQFWNDHGSPSIAGFPTAAEEYNRRLDPKEKVKDEFSTVKTRVLLLLKQYPRARDDYQYLCWVYAVKFGEMKFLEKNEFDKLMSINFSTVERCCRLLQHDVELPAEILAQIIPTTEEVRVKRKIRESSIREAIGKREI